MKNTREKEERNNELFKDIQSKKFKTWELCAKYQISIQAINNIKRRKEAELFIKE